MKAFIIFIFIYNFLPTAGYLLIFSHIAFVISDRFANAALNPVPVFVYDKTISSIA